MVPEGDVELIAKVAQSRGGQSYISNHAPDICNIYMIQSFKFYMIQSFNKSTLLAKLKCSACVARGAGARQSPLNVWPAPKLGINALQYNQIRPHCKLQY